MLEINKALLEKDFADASGIFIELLESVDENNFNRIPFPGSWTPAQLAEHVIKFTSGVAKVQTAPAVEANRPVDLNEGKLKAIFLDMNRKNIAPDFVQPGNDLLEKKVVIEKLKSIRQNIILAIDSNDLSLLCAGIQFPSLGELTRLEWIYFGIYHVQRHVIQLKNMLTYFKS